MCFCAGPIPSVLLCILLLFYLFDVKAIGGPLHQMYRACLLGRLSDGYVPDADTGTDSHPRIFSSERSLIRFEAPVSENLSPNMLLRLDTLCVYTQLTKYSPLLFFTLYSLIMFPFIHSPAPLLSYSWLRYGCRIRL